MGDIYLSSGKSFLMDCFRILAAIWVVIMHTSAICFPSNAYLFFHYGHAAVVVFFVLSGFVISYTTKVKNRGALKYAIARISRLYGVLLPALVITAIIEAYLKYYDANVYLSIYRGNSFIRYISSLFFLNEVWFFSSAPPLNAPLWSLSYEFSYYLLFGLVFFIKRFKHRLLLISFFVVIIGPKILFMMPIWLMGVLLMHLPKNVLNKKLSLMLSILFFVFAILIVIYLRTYPFDLGCKPLFFASGFITDWAIGLFFASGLWLFPDYEFYWFNRNYKFYQLFRKLADLTFSVYLLHNPFIVLFKSLSSKFIYTSVLSFAFAILFVFFCTIISGYFIEKCRTKTNFLFEVYIPRFARNSFFKHFLID